MNHFIRWTGGLALIISPIMSGPIVERLVRSSGSPALPSDLSHLLLALVLGIGLAGVAAVPISRKARLVSGALYLPLMGVIYMLWMLSFVCSAYGECL